MAKKQTNTTSIGFEDTIWRAADKLRGNLNASEYEGVVLGLIFHAVSGKSIEEQIVNTACSQSGDNLKNILNSLRAKSPIKLSWTHYRIILQENTDRGRVWYEQEAAREMWSTRTLPLSTLHICLQKRNCVER